MSRQDQSTTRKSKKETGPDILWYAENNINEYLKRFFSSPDYTSLDSNAQRAARDFVYQNRIVPFYQKRGANPPPREAYEGDEATIHTKAEAEKPGKITQFVMGGLSGLTEMGRSLLKLDLKIKKAAINTFETVLDEKLSVLERPKKDIETALRETEKAPNIFKDYLDSYSHIQTIGDKLVTGAGYVSGQLPAFKAAGAVLKIAGLGPLAEGTSTLRGLAGHKLLQQGIHDSLMGGLAGITLDEDPLVWAAMGIPARYALHGVYRGFGLLVRPFTYLYNNGGKKAVSEVLDKSIELASKSRTERPVPKEVGEDALAYINAEELDAVAYQKFEKPFNKLSPEQKVTVANDNGAKVAETVTNPSEEVIGEISATEHEILQQVSPEAKIATDEISRIASEAGVATPAQRIISKAKKSVADTKLSSMKSETPTVPEKDETVVAQLDALINKTKQVVLLEKGQSIPESIKIPMEIGVFRFKDGKTVLWDKATLTKTQIKEAKLRNRLDELLDYPASKEEVGEAITKGESPIIVQAKDVATDTEVSSIVASTSSVVETVEKLSKEFPKSEISVAPIAEANNVIQERFKPKIADIVKRTFSSAVIKGETIPTEEAALVTYPEINEVVSDATKAGLSVDQVKNIIKSEVAKMRVLADKNKAFMEKMKAAKATPAKVASKVTQITATAANIEAKESAKVLHIEQRDTGLDDATKFQILKKAGFNHTNEVPASERENIRNQFWPAVIKKTPFYVTDKTNVFTETPSKTTKVVLKPTKVLDLDTTYNPTLINAIRKDYPDIVTDNAMEALSEAQSRLGPKIDNWLRENGYDAIKTGGPNVLREGKRVMEDMEIEVLNPDIVKTSAKQARDTLASTAKAIGIDTKVVDKATQTTDDLEKKLGESLGQLSSLKQLKSKK